MVYTKQTWNNDDPATPLSGPRLTHIEDGIAVASDAVVVETGDETRPVGPPVVTWHDRREVQTVRPTNMGTYDVWETGWSSGSGPDPVEAYNVFGTAAPTGTWTLETDGTPTIQFARGFVCTATDAEIVGGRLWLPVGITVPNEVTFRLYGPNDDLDSTPVQTKVVSLTGVSAGSWVEGDYDIPTSFPSGETWMQSAQFTGSGDSGKYIFAPDTRLNGDPIASNGPLGTSLAWASYSGGLGTAYKIGTGPSTQPGSYDQSYPMDIKVTATI